MARPRKKQLYLGLITRTELIEILVSTVALIILVPMVFFFLPAHLRAVFSAMPGAALDAFSGGESAVGTTYWSAVEAYVDTAYQALDAAAATYNGVIEGFVNTTYAARDLSAAAYGGVAEQVVGGITAVHQAQMAGIVMMGNSMSDGADEVGAAYSAVGEWLSQSNARIDGRLDTSR